MSQISETKKFFLTGMMSREEKQASDSAAEAGRKPKQSPDSAAEAGREQKALINKKRKQRKQMKSKMRSRQKEWIICVELLVISGMFVFLFGEDFGILEQTARVQNAVVEQEQVYNQAPMEQEIYDLQDNRREAESEEEEPGKQEAEKEVSQEENDRQEEVLDILLVNKENALPEDYEVELKVLPDGSNRAAEEAYQPLCDMLAAGKKEGLVFEVCSSYRDVKRQQELFDEDLKALMRKGYTYEEAYEEVASETMPPGHSEHSTGLAFDIVAKSYQVLNAKQAKTAESKWLREHCAEYGFILRYPEGKEEITSIHYEPWHFRYIGDCEVAAYIMENNLTLEEYLGKVPDIY